MNYQTDENGNPILTGSIWNRFKILCADAIGRIKGVIRYIQSWKDDGSLDSDNKGK